MAYYLMTNEPDLFRDFKARHKLLSSATLIGNNQDLDKELHHMGEGAFVFAYLNSFNQQDDLILKVRHQAPGTRVIYLVKSSDSNKIPGHKSTPIGGDAYMDQEISQNDFKSTLEKLRNVQVSAPANRLENEGTGVVNFSNQQDLKTMTNHPKSKGLSQIFDSAIKKNSQKPHWQSEESLKKNFENAAGDSMSDKDQDLPLEDLGEVELASDEELDQTMIEAGGLDLGELPAEDLSISDEPNEPVSVDDGLDLELGGELSLSDEEGIASAEDSPPSLEGTSGLSLDEIGVDDFSDLDDLSHSSSPVDMAVGNDLGMEDLSFEETPELGPDEQTIVAQKNEIAKVDEDELGLEFGSPEATHSELSDQAKEKLKEIDEIMVRDATNAALNLSTEIANIKNSDEGTDENDLDIPLVSDDLDLASLSFSEDLTEGGLTKRNKIDAKKIQEDEPATRVVKISKPGVSKTQSQATVMNSKVNGAELREISNAYSEEIERTQATISNLRSDREDLVQKVQKLEEDKILNSRLVLSLRAELDEKKIELTIIRKKLNEEITELKDKLKFHDEKKLILEEKNKLLLSELDKMTHKNKIDVKKVQNRERELEQKLELMKADAESQIRNRDLKILELKRKIDSMEFDMESITTQEKKSVESRFELEDKLDKAIKTLRSAISVLENESEKSGIIDALKKNIDM